MTKEEFLVSYEENKKRLSEKYSHYLYLLAYQILNLNHADKICEDAGFTIKKVYKNQSMHSLIYYNDVNIGIIHFRGFPMIEFFNGKRRYAKNIESHTDIIKPIDGVHGVLSWHTVKGKCHCLDNGGTILHLNPIKITNKEMEKFLIKSNLMDKVEEYKKIEKENEKI